MPMILGIDLGISTGLALLDEYGVLRCSETVTGDRHGLRDLLYDLQNEYDIPYVAIEEPIYVRGPMYVELRANLVAVQCSILTAAETVYVTPSQWKTSVAKKYKDVQRVRDLAQTPHEVDAACIAYYVALTEGVLKGPVFHG